MFWNKKKKAKKNKTPEKLSGEALRTQAMDNARQAKEHLGDETVQKIAAIMAKKNSNPMAQAKAQIQKADSGKVIDSILYLRDEE